MQAKKEKIKRAENEITHYNRAQSVRGDHWLIPHLLDTFLTQFSFKMIF